MTDQLRDEIEQQARDTLRAQIIAKETELIGLRAALAALEDKGGEHGDSKTARRGAPEHP